jgi:FkbM family methyltransferase
MHITIPNLPELLRTKTNIIPLNIFEIGASNGADAGYLQQSFEIDSNQVYCFEANPGNYQTLCNNFPNFNNFHIAISDFTGKQIFQLHNPAADISSFKKRISHYVYDGHYLDNYDEIELDTYRMDDFINKYKINSIDICKIDVEGCSYEVLSGFGDKLNIVKSIHIEGELVELYESQKLFEDFKILLLDAGFTMIDYYDFDNATQCDSIWIRKDLLK